MAGSAALGLRAAGVCAAVVALGLSWWPLAWPKSRWGAALGLIVLVLGLGGLVVLAQMPLRQAFMVDLAFVPGDLVKCVLCALVVHTVAKALPDWRIGGRA